MWRIVLVAVRNHWARREDGGNNREAFVSLLAVTTVVDGWLLRVGGALNTDLDRKATSTSSTVARESRYVLVRLVGCLCRGIRVV